MKKYDNLIENSDNKCKTVWTLVNTLKNVKQRKIEVDGDPQDIANEMNNHFIKAGIISTESIVNTNNDEKIGKLDKSIRLKKISLVEIKEVIKSLKNKHSSGYDEISNHIIKQTAEEIIEPLTHIIDNSLKHGIFPDKLKIAIVKPIHKKGDINDFNNYRPISILPSFSKIFEMIYCSQLMEFLLKNEILSDNQHGYTKGKSTKTAVYKFINKIVETFESGDLAMGIFLDLTKAYDCLDSGKLLRKLERYGIRGPALQWVRSYFTMRKQMVEMEMEEEVIRSNMEELLLGIPQGSIAGPLFFIIYINDYTVSDDSENNKTTTINYADDTNLLIIESLYPDLRNICEIKMEETNEWFKSNNLLLNKEKTKIVLFTPSSTGIEELNSITLNQSKYQLVEHTKFLGVHMDNHLDWKEHITNLCTKIQTAIYGFRITSKYICQRNLKMVYHATIEAKLRFSIIFYGSGNIKPLFVLQKKAIRILNNMRYDQSCRGTFKNLGLLTIYGIYIQECVIFIKKNPNMFRKYENQKSYYNTRNNNYIYPRHNLTTSQKQAEYRCLKMYNSLPKDISMISDIKKFKKKLYKYLVELEPYGNEDYFA